MSTERALLRGAFIPTLFVGLISIALSTWLKGSAGLVGALLAVPIAASIILILEEVVFPQSDKH